MVGSVAQDAGPEDPKTHGPVPGHGCSKPSGRTCVWNASGPLGLGWSLPSLPSLHHMRSGCQALYICCLLGLGFPEDLPSGLIHVEENTCSNNELHQSHLAHLEAHAENLLAQLEAAEVVLHSHVTPAHAVVEVLFLMVQLPP